MSIIPTPEDEASQIMRSVRKELLRRATPASGADVGGDAATEALMLPRWRPEQGALPEKHAYTLPELLQYDDEQFIEVAYQVILRRPADEVGFQHYSQQLRAGIVSKVEILGRLRWSEEGVHRGVHVDGLLLPFTIQKWRHRRWLGPAIEWAYTLARLPRLARQQAVTSARVVREARRIGQLLNHVSDGVGNQAEATVHRVAELSAELRMLEDRTRMMERLAAGIEARLADAETAAANQSRLEEQHTATHRRTDERLDALENACTHLAERISGAETSISVINSLAPHRVDRNLDSLYAAFEEAFRGSDELIKARVSPYLSDIAAVVAPGQGELIIDIGCGRGEWLQVLRDAGYRTLGIDTNEVFVQTCRSKDLDVTHGDAFEVLKQVPDASVAGVTSMHLVEHLSFESLIDLLDECRRILRPGGILILETPNPENVLVGSNWFYMDPTHRNPLPPGLLFWLTRSRGFSDVCVERLTEARDVPMPELLPVDAVGATSINMMLEHFRAPVDYAVIARRGA